MLDLHSKSKLGFSLGRLDPPRDLAVHSALPLCSLLLPAINLHIVIKVLLSISPRGLLCIVTGADTRQIQKRSNTGRRSCLEPALCLHSTVGLECALLFVFMQRRC